LTRRGYRVTNSQGAIYVWVEVPTPDRTAFFQALLDRGIVVSPGESFGVGGEGYFRMALVPTLEQIERAIGVWETIQW
jgi:aspartate/methionine/tyrosine aminotransferase